MDIETLTRAATDDLPIITKMRQRFAAQATTIRDLSTENWETNQELETIRQNLYRAEGAFSAVCLAFVLLLFTVRRK